MSEEAEKPFPCDSCGELMRLLDAFAIIGKDFYCWPCFEKWIVGYGVHHYMRGM